MLQEERDRAAGIHVASSTNNNSNLSDSDSKDSTGNVVRRKKGSGSSSVSLLFSLLRFCIIKTLV